MALEEDIRVNLFPPESDSGSVSAAAESRSGLTRSNSLESGVTVESSRCCSCESCGDADTRPDECCGWTNERHNSYLDYLEVSFVRQLYCLMGGKTQRSFRTHDLPANSYKFNDQFGVPQNGCRQKINFGTKRTHLGTSSHFRFRENPSTNSFAEPSGSYTGATADGGNFICNEETNHSGDKEFSRTSLRNPVGRKCSTESTEASGQNFTDEDKEEKQSLLTMSKRHKRDPEPDCSKNDQVVPHGTVKQKGVSSAKQIQTRIDA